MPVIVISSHNSRTASLVLLGVNTVLDQIYAELLADDQSADGVIDSTRQTAQIEITGQLVDAALFRGTDSDTLFLAGRSLRNLVSQLFG